MQFDLPDAIAADTLARAAPAIETLRLMLDGGAPPPGLTERSLGAVLAILAAVTETAEDEAADLSPSQAAERLSMARPTVMRLITRGELPSRKEGGHYVLSARDLRSFQIRLALVRREALSGLTGMAEEFGF